MTMRAFPVLYAKDVEQVAAFFVQLRRAGAELAVTTEDSPRTLAGVEPGQGPRSEMFVYVEDVDHSLSELRAGGARVLRAPTDMPWGERLAYLADPEGNIVALAAAVSQ
jgi:lactoylglutathione lyase